MGTVIPSETITDHHCHCHGHANILKKVLMWYDGTWWFPCRM